MRNKNFETKIQNVKLINIFCDVHYYGCCNLLPKRRYILEKDIIKNKIMRHSDLLSHIF